MLRADANKGEQKGMHSLEFSMIRVHGRGAMTMDLGHPMTGGPRGRARV